MNRIHPYQLGWLWFGALLLSLSWPIWAANQPSGSISWFDGDRPRTLQITSQSFADPSLTSQTNQPPTNQTPSQSPPTNQTPASRKKANIATRQGSSQRLRLHDEQGNLYLMDDKLLVHFRQPQSSDAIQQFAHRHQLTTIKPLGLSNAWLFRCASIRECPDLSRKLYQLPEVRYAYPDMTHPRFSRFYPNDPRFTDQWHLLNTGQEGGLIHQDVDILTAWNDVTGSGVRIVVVDDGVEIGHEDLSANVIAGAHWDYVDNDADPGGGWHGTMVAGVSAARGGNGIGVTGAAPKAGLVGIRLLGAGSE